MTTLYGKITVWIFFLMMGGGCTTPKEAKRNVMQKTVFIINELSISDKIKWVAKDMQYWISKNDSCRLLSSDLNETISDHSIILTTTIPSHLLGHESQKQFEALNDQGFWINSKDDKVWIIGRSELGLSHGVYSYLEHFGYRWFWPGELWAHIPDVTDFFADLNILDDPDFEYRWFTGTGGFVHNPVIDPDNNVEKEWNAYRIRNKWAQPFKIGGHAGQGFNRRNKEILSKRPEYLAENDRQRIGWWKNAKLCISNTDAVDLFVEDRINQVKRKIKKDGIENVKTISAEPADGGKHCTCQSCLEMGSISDRVFYVANRVAQAVDHEFPNFNIKTTLYAYNQHAAVPKHELHEDILVFVAPYAFQREASPEMLIKQWAEKNR